LDLPQILKEFPDASFRGVDLESLLGDVEVSSRQTRVPVRKGHSFGSDRYITLKIIEEFQDDVSLGVDVESLRGEAEVLSLQTRVSVRKGHNF
jgi:hypothetical protein